MRMACSGWSSTLKLSLVTTASPLSLYMRGELRSGPCRGQRQPDVKPLWDARDNCTLKAPLLPAAVSPQLRSRQPTRSRRRFRPQANAMTNATINGTGICTTVRIALASAAAAARSGVSRNDYAGPARCTWRGSQGDSVRSGISTEIGCAFGSRSCHRHHLRRAEGRIGGLSRRALHGGTIRW